MYVRTCARARALTRQDSCTHEEVTRDLPAMPGVYISREYTLLETSLTFLSVRLSAIYQRERCVFHFTRGSAWCVSLSLFLSYTWPSLWSLSLSLANNAPLSPDPMDRVLRDVKDKREFNGHRDVTRTFGDESGARCRRSPSRSRRRQSFVRTNERAYVSHVYATQAIRYARFATTFSTAVRSEMTRQRRRVTTRKSRSCLVYRSITLRERMRSRFLATRAYSLARSLLPSLFTIYL